MARTTDENWDDWEDGALDSATRPLAIGVILIVAAVAIAAAAVIYVALVLLQVLPGFIGPLWD